jgi:hypothetical protein
MDDEIIQVLMLNESAIQKPTKFHGPHCRRSFSTGLRSWFVSCVRSQYNSVSLIALHCADRRGTDRVARLSYHKLSACQARFIFNGGFISPDFEPGSGLHDFDRWVTESGEARKQQNKCQESSKQNLRETQSKVCFTYSDRSY